MSTPQLLSLTVFAMQAAEKVLDSAPARLFIEECSDLSIKSYYGVCLWQVFDKAFLPEDPPNYIVSNPFSTQVASQPHYVDCRHCDAVIRASAAMK